MTREDTDTMAPCVGNLDGLKCFCFSLILLAFQVDQPMGLQDRHRLIRPLRESLAEHTPSTNSLPPFQPCTRLCVEIALTTLTVL
jgi:hypothetical protein